MACRVGMTSNVSARKADWSTKHRMRNWKIVAKGLTYDQAQRMEREYAEKNGCTYSPGGTPKSGRIYSVYYFEF